LMSAMSPAMINIDKMKNLDNNSVSNTH